MDNKMRLILAGIGKILSIILSPSGQSRQKNSLKECVNTVSYCQKYTPTDCFFRGFCPLGL